MSLFKLLALSGTSINLFEQKCGYLISETIKRKRIGQISCLDKYFAQFRMSLKIQASNVPFFSNKLPQALEKRGSIPSSHTFTF